MVYTYREYRTHIAERIGVWSFWWDFVFAGAVFIVPWAVKSARAGAPDVPELEDFFLATVTLLGVEFVRRFAGRGRAAYDLYREAATRADLAEDDARKFQETRAHANWHELSGRFLTLREYGINAQRVVYTEGGKEREEWEIDGTSEAHKRSFKAVCALAGDTLTISKVWADLPAHIKDEKDPLVRWLLFVADREGMKESFSGDQTRDGVLIHEYTSRTFEELPMASKRLCQDNLLHDRMVNS